MTAVRPQYLLEHDRRSRMSRLQSSSTEKGLLLRLLVCSLAASLQLVHASRALQQANPCVVLGSSSLRNCNNPTCNCEGKSRDGNSCRCRGECDATYRNCDGNQNNQANCDCSGNPLLGATDVPQILTPQYVRQSSQAAPAAVVKAQPTSTCNPNGTAGTAPPVGFGVGRRLQKASGGFRVGSGPTLC